MAWMVATALSAGKAAVVELPTMREVEDLMPMLRNYGSNRSPLLRPAAGWAMSPKKQSYARIRVASDAAMEHLLFDSGEDDKASSLF